MSKKTLQFLRPVGKSVPGGPFAKGETYEVNEETLRHPLIRGLLSSGEIRVLGNVGEDDQKGASASLKKQLTAAKKRIAELEAKVSEFEKAAASSNATLEQEDKEKSES
ncbi:MAG: hypothetical protein LBQ42_13620 [Synergistaceae bacterium]|jgi:hypothetical protein|nr:hypothetical protein [Synergistaceae bacterium]